MLPNISQFDVDDYDEGVEEMEIGDSHQTRKPKKPRMKGPLDRFVAPKANPKKNDKEIYKAIDKELREKTSRAIARFFMMLGFHSMQPLILVLEKCVKP